MFIRQVRGNAWPVVFLDDIRCRLARGAPTRQPATRRPDGPPGAERPDIIADANERHARRGFQAVRPVGDDGSPLLESRPGNEAQESEIASAVRSRGGAHCSALAINVSGALDAAQA